jgi:exonuclease III
MYHQWIAYSKEELLGYNINSYTGEYNIINRNLWTTLANRYSYHHSYQAKGLSYKRTKRGCRAGWRKHSASKDKTIPRGVNTENLIYIKPAATNIGKKGKTLILPSLYYTNCRSLNAYKCCELERLIRAHDTDIACLTETWFDESRANHWKIADYNTYTCNRSNRIGGGVAACVKKSYTVKTIKKWTSDKASALWLRIISEPTRSISLCILYHPPDADSNNTLNHLDEQLYAIDKKYPDGSIIIFGDFNHLLIDNLKNCHALRHLINFPTRQDARLDLCLTNINEYSDCQQLAPLANNDHCGVLLNSCGVNSAQYQKVTKRQWSHQAKTDVICEIIQQNWAEVLTAKDVNTKVQLLYSRILDIVNKYAPLKTKKIRIGYHIESTFISKLRKAKDKAYKAGNPVWKAIAKYLRISIKKQQKALTDRTINKCKNGKTWWRHIKNLTNPVSRTTPSNYNI